MDTFVSLFVIVFFILVFVTLIAALAYLFLQMKRAQGRYESLAKEYQSKIENTVKNYESKIQEIAIKHKDEIEKARKQSVDNSRHTIKGQIAEQMAPLLQGFPYQPSDSRFIGDPIDYLVFKGYTDLRDKHMLNDDFEVVIVDVKYNTASLSPGQRAIAKAIENGKVRFEVIKIQNDGTVEKSSWKPSKSKATSNINSLLDADEFPIKN